MSDNGGAPGRGETTSVDIADLSNIAIEYRNVDAFHDFVLSIHGHQRAQSARVMPMCLASAGGAITPTGIGTMVSYLDQTGLEHTLEKLRNQMYPVGSLYFSTNSTSPATIYGGTWERYAKGRTLVSVNESESDFTAGKIGGEKNNTHRHWMPMGKEGSISNPSQYTALTGVNGDVAQKLGLGTRDREPSDIGSEFTWHGIFLPNNNGNSGYREFTTYDETIDIMNPYVAVYIWRRTA